MKKVFIFLLVLITVNKTIGQVNLQTGSATFSLPMFNWQDDKSRLNSVVALNYNSSNGLKVSDVASNVGQGWSMIAGGQITRIQSGEPDDQKPWDGTSPDDITKYPAGYLYDPVSASTGCPGALVRYPIYEDKNRVYKQNNSVAADKELDHFAFSFNGRSGIFILNKNGNQGNGDVGIFLGDTRMKVWFTRDETMVNSGIRTTITAFYIQDENGLIYKFSQHQLTKLTKTVYCDGNLVNSQTQPHFDSHGGYHEMSLDDGSILNPYIINGWYLTEIRDALTQRVITINYSLTPLNINSNAGTAIASYEQKRYSIISHYKSISQTPQISNITYPDGHLITFNYGAARVDLTGDFVLASVDIQYNSRYLSRYELKTSYFILNRYGYPVSDYQKQSARLCLQSVKKIGIDLKADDPPYLFDYYLGSSVADDIVPPPFFHIKDIWGYYNGTNNNAYSGGAIPITTPLASLSQDQLLGLCFLHIGSNAIVLNAKPGYAKNGLLKEIDYPTGGSLKYTYDQNTGLIAGVNTTVGGVHVSQTSVTDGGYSNDCTHPLITNYTYNISPGSSQSSLWGMEMPVNNMGFASDNYYAPELKYYHWGLDCFPLGCCKYKYQYPGITSRENSLDLTGHEKTMETISDILNVVGAITQIMDVLEVIGVMSGGTLAPVALAIDIVLDLFNLVFTCFNDYSKDYFTIVYYNSDLNSINPLPAQFKRVEISESSGTNGKTVVEFTSSDDYPIWEPTNTAFSAKQRFAYWAYGLPKKTTVFDVAGNPVKQNENVYDFTKAKNAYTMVDHSGNIMNIYPSCKCLVTKSSSQRNTNWADPALYNAPNTPYVTQSNGNLMVEMYTAIAGRVELDTAYERMFKPGNPTQYLQTTTRYSYNNLYNYDINQVTTTESDGTQKNKNIKYNSDFWDPVTLNVLSQNNIFSMPVETIISGPNGITIDKATEFVKLSNGDIKPYRTIERQDNAPVALTSPSYPGPGGSLPSDYKQTQTFTYGTTGNLIGMNDQGNRVVSNIYDYNDKYVVASVINADPVADKSAYTSFETQLFGGWTLNGTANYVTTSSVTGTTSFALSGANSLSAPLNTAKPYILSFWASNGSVTVSSGTLVKSAPLINGFTYYEYNIAQGTATVTVSSSNSTIDELRLYPKTARMRTVSYDPLIGKTSECDENNRITYYEYDDHARLRFIKDDYKNIIKMYEYNVATKLQTGACVTTYSNLAISETFTRNNCATGYTGSQVTYTIPAGKYTSTISQATVDMQAQYELDQLGQNYANSNGTCILLYYNAALSQNFTKQACPVGYIGNTITYSVPAGKYTSTIDQAHADQLAQDEIDANGQAFANAPGNSTCITNYGADWIGTGSVQCEVGANGTLTGNQLFQVIDQNPNSPTYNQTQWTNGGQSPATCPAPCPNCGGIDQKCINSICETGIRVCTQSTPTGTYDPSGNPYYYNVYHYEFSDGSWTINYSETTIYACW